MRALLAVMFFVAGVFHFIWPDAYLSIMPPYVPWPSAMVFISGVAEIAGAVGILLPRFRRMAGIGLIALLIAVFPANLQMLAQEMQRHEFRSHTLALWLRLPLQAVFIFAVWKATIPNRKLKPT